MGSRVPVPAPASGAGLGRTTLIPHWPVASRLTRFGALLLSPYCTFGSSPWQAMLLPMRLLMTSLPSGSLATLSDQVRLPPTWTLTIPIQHVCRPVTVKLPPTESSSKSVYSGTIFASPASLDHGAGMGYFLVLKHPDEAAPPAAPPPPPVMV